MHQRTEGDILCIDLTQLYMHHFQGPPLPRCPRDLTPLFTPPGQNEGTISVVEGETLSVIEEDKGDGWTRIRRNEDEEGYVPTSYVEVYLDKNAKGAKTYI